MHVVESQRAYIDAWHRDHTDLNLVPHPEGCSSALHELFARKELPHWLKNQIF